MRDPFNRIPRRGKARLAAIAIVALPLSVDLTAAAQNRFRDDAGRSVTLPDTVARVFAAGAPAEVLIYTLAPEMLVGRNHAPSAAALELTPPEYRRLVQITNLPDRDDPRDDAELLALTPDVYIDYGNVDSDYVSALEAITTRTHVPGIILEASLSHVPEVYRRLGGAFGIAQRGELLAAEAERILSRYRGALAAAGVKVYLACAQNALSPCLQGQSSSEVAELLGAINVAGSIETAPRRALTVDEIRALAPTVIIALNKASAAAIRSDAEWRDVPAVAAGRVHAPPDAPFNWGPRPPSINRLLGMIWLVYVLRNQPFDETFFADVGAFFETYYHVTPSREQLVELVAD